MCHIFGWYKYSTRKTLTKHRSWSKIERVFRGWYREQYMHSKTSDRIVLARDEKSRALIVPEKYEVVREAILAMLPASGEGMTWAELAERIAPYLPENLFRHMGTVGWYARAVQIDLEAGGIIERVPGSKPPRLRRMA
jgi:hypothetical protein